MAKGVNVRTRLLYVLDYLRNYSSEMSPVSATDIIKMLENNGMSAERKAIYEDIAALTEFGYDIVKTSSPKSGYFLASREFEDAEIYLLADAVRTADFITVKKTKQLVNKLYSVLGEGREDVLQKDGISSLRKCSNESIYYNIDLISTAIARKKQILVEYITRHLENRSIEKTVKTFTINPYALIWSDDNYYLVGNNIKYDNFTNLRVDKIKSVTITNTPREACPALGDKEFDVAAYTQRTFNMFSGEESQIELKCKNELLDKVIDRFTDNIYIRNCEDGSFSFSVKAFVSEGLIGWILQFGGGIEVISPRSLRDTVKEKISEMSNAYNKEA